MMELSKRLSNRVQSRKITGSVRNSSRRVCDRTMHPCCILYETMTSNGGTLIVQWRSIASDNWPGKPETSMHPRSACFFRQVRTGQGWKMTRDRESYLLASILSKQAWIFVARFSLLHGRNVWRSINVSCLCRYHDSPLHLRGSW